MAEKEAKVYCPLCYMPSPDLIHDTAESAGVSRTTVISAIASCSFLCFARGMQKGMTPDGRFGVMVEFRDKDAAASFADMVSHLLDEITKDIDGAICVHQKFDSRMEKGEPDAG